MTTHREGEEEPRVVIEESLTVTRVATIKQQLLPQLEGVGDLILDLSGVREVDAAGLQLLWATHRSCQARGRRLKLCGGSGEFNAALRVAGLGEAGTGETLWAQDGEVTDG